MATAAFSTTATYARYVTSATTDAEARVALWDVAMAPGDIADDTLTLDGTTDSPQVSYAFALSNDSEVVAQATLDLTLSVPLQSGVEVYVEDAAGQRLASTCSDDGLEYTFDAGRFAIDQEPEEFLLVFAGKTQDATLESQSDVEVTLTAMLDQVV